MELSSSGETNTVLLHDHS